MLHHQHLYCTLKGRVRKFPKKSHYFSRQI
nr:MAG TPA: hypothetical protein [Caudoviricetes sp.]